MSAPRMSKGTRQFVIEVERRGGTVQSSRDGHLKVFDRNGQFIIKIRGQGQNGSTDASVKAQILRRVTHGTGGTHV